MQDTVEQPCYAASHEPSRAANSWPDRLATVWLLVLAVMCAWLLIVPLRALFAHVPINYDEGWNAFHTSRLMAGGPLYPPVSSGITINYPPLSFYLVGGLGHFLGDNVFAGRVVALLSEAVVAVNVGLIARRIGAGWRFAVIAALMFSLTTQIYFSDYVAMDDPQWLGHALQTTALVVLLGRDTISLRRLAAVMLLLLLGGLVKQSLVALPLAVTLWIGWRRRPLLIPWLALCAAGIATAAILAYAAYGRAIFEQVLGNSRNFTNANLIWVGQDVAPHLLIFILFGFIGFILARTNARAAPVAIYAIAAAITGVVLLSAQGVYYNALFDFVIAIMPGSALLGERIAASGSIRLAGQSWSRPAAALLLAFPCLGMLPHAQDNQRSLIAALDNQPAWQSAIASIDRAKGPVACETLALCYWAGRPSAIEFFNDGQLMLTHPAFKAALADTISRQGLALIQTDHRGGSYRLSKAVNAAIRANYVPASADPVYLYVPGSPPAQTTTASPAAPLQTGR